MDGQANVAIHVLQGERELAKDCRSLARFDLKGIPPMPAGIPRVEVKFLIDANGILHVSAREQRSGTEAEIDVQPSYGLTDEQVESMILDSFDSAEEDFRQRQVIEARNEAGTILAALERERRVRPGDSLPARKRSALPSWKKALNEVQGEDDYPAIRAVRSTRSTRAPCDWLNWMMDSAVSTALKGKTMDQADMGEGPDAPHPVAKAEFE